MLTRYVSASHHLLVRHDMTFGADGLWSLRPTVRHFAPLLRSAARIRMSDLDRLISLITAFAQFSDDIAIPWRERAANIAR